MTPNTETTEMVGLLAKLTQARETNRKLHRRVQRLEGEAVSRLVRRKLASLEWERKAWFREYDRVCKAHKELGLIYQMCAPVLGLPCEHMHSTMDLRPGRNINPQGHVFANAYLSKQGGVESHRVVDVVRATLDAAEQRASSDVKVEGLRWEVTGELAFWGSGVTGTYEVFASNNRFRVAGLKAGSRQFDTADEARQACEEDYRSRILSALQNGGGDA